MDSSAPNILLPPGSSPKRTREAGFGPVFLKKTPTYLSSFPCLVTYISDSTWAHDGCGDLRLFETARGALVAIRFKDFFIKNEPILASFGLFLTFSHYNFNNTN